VNVQTRPILIISRNQQRHAKRPTHNALLALCALAKPQGQIAYRLRAALDAERLVVVEGVVLALDARVLDHAPCVGLQARHGASDVAVDLDNLFDRARLEERRRYALFYAEDDAFAGCYLGVVLVWERCGVVKGGRTPIAVEPSLMASREYSTWKRRPSGEKVLCVCERESGGGGDGLLT
jgi:hypothetical protein